MSIKLLIVNGPNLNLLGRREATIYGEISFDEYLIKIKNDFPDIDIQCFQSNSESEIIEVIQKAESTYTGLIINAGAYSHTSIAISDAIRAIKLKTIEVHISNIYARENYRHSTLLSSQCWGSISGFGMLSYSLAINAFINQNV
jgi:3-dehydroquinate dehydratase-2